MELDCDGTIGMINYGRLIYYTQLECFITVRWYKHFIVCQLCEEPGHKGYDFPFKWIYFLWLYIIV